MNLKHFKYVERKKFRQFVKFLTLEADKKKKRLWNT
jgi:hypothetical protein